MLQVRSQAGSQQSNTAEVSASDSTHRRIVPLTTAYALTVAVAELTNRKHRAQFKCMHLRIPLRMWSSLCVWGN